MGIGVSLFFIAVGAILTWALNASVSGIDLNAVGVILMIVGAIGVVLSVIFWSTIGAYGFGGGGGGSTTTVIDDRHTHDHVS
jgi:Domain of unknown function (DUF6458)